METRKVQLAGGSTYTVSLPKRWADEHGIEAGRKLHLYPDGDASLIVRATPPQETEQTTARISVNGYTDNNLRRTVQACYAVGLDEFILTTSNGFSTTQRRVITDAAKNLVGLEPLNETDTRIGFRNLLSNKDKSIRQSVLQLKYVMVWMHRNAITALANSDADRAQRVIERDDEADRLFGLVNRRFQRTLVSMQEVEQLGFDRPTMFDYYTTARQLERVADHAEKIATIVTRVEDESAIEPPEELISLARQSREIVEDAASVLLGGGTVEQAYTALTKRDQLLDDTGSLDRVLHDTSTPDSRHLAIVLDSVRRTAEYGGNIAEAMIQASARSEKTVVSS